MNIQKLYDMQRTLDQHILDKHEELKGQDNLDWKVLALQVELGECANEWRGFKKWSNDRKPRTNKEVKCHACEGTGWIENLQYAGRKSDGPAEWECEFCKGEGFIEKNPLLEEYVDCLHFILSIGVEKDWTFEKVDLLNSDESLEIQFSEAFLAVSHFYVNKWLSNYERLLIVFLSLGKSLGLTWKQIEQAYFDKNKVNHERQLTGY
ncbi:dUTP diphosphatase [Lysinibacillus odysseyi]|uniref:dUTPase n=1 Tax=Lysinibacillus odysseyi 34hs-1 = NBRC 100172 TaxID=1220589 RepID=A0A0A3JQX7_9BACI|nr:dUTP diphosphatase [Lysinibacillus odysseyi]KGR89417.1 hypothetical protein CD32_00340 [Lysinibacillus odysseyi 34hs-1 = NBRC 100172]